jgi:hypothetical protein
VATAKKTTTKQKKATPASKTKRSKKGKIDYDKLIKPGSASGKVPSFMEFLMEGETFEGLDLKRDRRPGREIKL